MKPDTRKYLNKEAEYCDAIWKEHMPNGDLDHYHICDFELINMFSRYKDSYRKFDKKCIKDCEKYLASIGHKRDEHLECCDYCPHMRYLTLTEDKYFVNIATLGMDKYIFQEEKEDDGNV